MARTRSFAFEASCPYYRGGDYKSIPKEVICCSCDNKCHNSFAAEAAAVGDSHGRAMVATSEKDFLTASSEFEKLVLLYYYYHSGGPFNGSIRH